MGALYLGTSKVRNVYLGGTKVRQIYLGTNKIFNAGVSFWIGDTHYEFESGSQMYTITSSTTVRFDDFDSSDYLITACLIGGGGGSSCNSYHFDYYKGSTKVMCCAGAGGEGGQVITGINFVPTVGTNYSVSIGAGGSAGTHTRKDESVWGHSENETNGGTGGDSTFNGYTAYGGNGGTHGTSYDSRTASIGGTGRAGADGGAGSYCGWPNNQVPQLDAGNGASGTLFNGTYYGGGGCGGGSHYIFRSYWDDWGAEGTHAAGSPGAGQSNYGGGGNSKDISGAVRDGYWGSVTTDAAGNPGNGGALLLLLQSR